MEIRNKVKHIKNWFPRKQQVVRPGIASNMTDTKELDLWRGEFGNDYRERNQVTDEAIGQRMVQWSYNLNAIANFGAVKGLPESILEVGCGGGVNLLAIERIYRNNGIMPHMFALEPNIITRNEAQARFTKENFFPIWLANEASATNLMIPNYSVELVFTSGVLIHIHPDQQLKAMEELYRTSKRFIVSMEYFSPDLREITYHNQQALWTRDYGSLWLDNFNVRAIACFFSWKRMSGLDNITTWIFEKVN